MATEQSILAVVRAARPSFRSRHDKAAFAIHAAFLSSGYVLNANGTAALRDDALSSASSDEVGIENWNEIDDNYAFVYSSPKKGAKKVLVKGIALKDKLFVDALQEGVSEPLHLEIDVGDFVEEHGGTNYGSQFKNLGKLASEVNKNLISKLNGDSKPSSSTQQASSGESNRGFAVPEHTEPQNSPVHSSFIVPPVPAFGESDLFPGVGAGMYPSRGDFGGGSMLVGPNDPRFFGGRSGGIPGLPGNQGVIPPGARFDPFGPPGVPGFEPGRFVRDPRRPGGGTHPDLQHFGNDPDFI